MNRAVSCVLSCVALASAAAAQPSALRGAPTLLVREEWRETVLASYIGWEGLFVADLDGDGDREIVTTARGDHWFVLTADPDEGFVEEWSSDQSPRAIGSLRVAQLDGDPAREVVIGTSAGLTVYDGATKQVQLSWTLPSFPDNTPRSLSIADVDGDGALEAVFCGAGLQIRDFATGVQEYANAAYDCQTLAVGDVDGDAGIEIVLARGFGTGYVLDGATRAVEWAYAPGFAARVRLGDVDGDGRQEIVSANGNAGGGVRVFDAELQAARGQIAVSSGVHAVEVFDLDGDGALEIVAGIGGVYSFLRVYDAASLGLEWEVATTTDFASPGISAIAWGNADGDPAPELVWGSGIGGSEPDYLHVLDTATRLFEWRSLGAVGPFVGPSHGDLDADGSPEVLYASARSNGPSAGIWFARDARTKALEHAGMPSPPSFGDLPAIAAANVDADPALEVFVPRHITAAGWTLVCHDGPSDAEQWRSAPLPEGLSFGALQVGEVDGDPGLELVAGTRIDHSGAPGSFVYVYDAATGALEWRVPVADSLAALRLANVDDDPATEIVAAAPGRAVFVVDGTTHAVTSLGDQDASALEVVDRDGDGRAEILVGTESGIVRVIDLSGSVVETIFLGDDVTALVVREVTGDTTADYLIVAGNELLIQDGVGGSIRWTSGPIDPSPFPGVGRYQGLYVADIDDDGRQEIVLGHDMGIRVYEIPLNSDLVLAVLDSPDPVLVGGNVTYQWTVTNPGPIAVPAVTFSMALPPSTGLVSWSPGPPTCVPTGGALDCSLGSLAEASTATVSVQVTTGVAGALSSTGTVTSSGGDPDPANNVATALTLVGGSAQADLAVTVDDGRAIAAPGQVLTYEVAVANEGPFSVPGVALALVVPAGLTNPVYTAQRGSYAPGTGAWTGLDLSSGQRAVMTVAGRVAAAASGTLALSATVSAPAGVTDPVPSNDFATDVDVVTAPSNELSHGTVIAMSAAPAGEQHFRMRQLPRQSYEVVLDSGSGDLGEPDSPVRLERLASDLSILTEAVPAGMGSARSLRWTTGGATVDDQAIRVRSTQCETDCGSDDLFRLRVYDTTYQTVRFNNGGGQVSVLVLQNTGRDVASGTVWFWSADGTLLASVALGPLSPHAVFTLNTAGVPALAGLTGSLTITNDAAYGALVGKVVSVDPANGFAFDTPVLPRPR